MKSMLLIITIFVATSVSHAQTPCKCCQSEFRQFDFWIGDWDVFVKGNKLAGTNKVIIQQDSCLIQENWSSGGGKVTGTSYNFYNASSGKWQQIWIDNSGGNLQLEGQLMEGKMVLSSKELPNAKGQMEINRITWTPHDDGSVQQLWEASTDKGKTWSVKFDGLYKRKR